MFLRPSIGELIDRITSDLITRLGGAVLRRRVVSVLARVVAGAAYEQHGHLVELSRQLFPDTSDVTVLERQAGFYGLIRIAATYAAGPVTCTGNDGAGIARGTVLQRADGAQYVATSDVVIAAGTATVPVAAIVAGLEGNLDVGVTLTCVSPVLGVTATATVAGSGLTGGGDPESDEALRARVLARMRQPPHGGAATDYVTWAREVPGVTRAWVYPQELGPGTVTVRFVRDDDASGIMPDVDEVAAVQAYIDERRPVTADVTVVAPIDAPLDFTIAVTPSTDEVKAAVVAELTDFLRRDSEPGRTTLRSQLQGAIVGAPGVTDFGMTVPSADVTHTTGRMASMGDVTWL